MRTPDARERGENGDGMALAGIIVGWIAFAVSIAVVIFYVVFVLVIGIWAESVDDNCYYDDRDGYVCN